MFDKKLTIDQRVKITCTPVDSKNRSAKLDGPIVFECEGAQVETIDDKSCYISAEAAGEYAVTLTADADIGEGVQTITDAGILRIGDPAASSLGVAVEVEDKPE